MSNKMNFLSRMLEGLCTANWYIIQPLVNCCGGDPRMDPEDARSQDSPSYSLADGAMSDPSCKEMETVKGLVDFIASFSQIVASFEQAGQSQGCELPPEPAAGLVSKLIKLRRTGLKEVEQWLEVCVRDESCSLLRSSSIMHMHRGKCDLHQQILDLKDRFIQAETDLLRSRQQCEDLTTALLLDKVVVSDLNQLNDNLLSRKTELETRVRKLEEQTIEMETRSLSEAVRVGEPSICPHMFYMTVKTSYQLLKALTREITSALSDRSSDLALCCQKLCPAGVTLTRQGHFIFVIHSHLNDIIFSAFESEGFGYEIGASAIDSNRYRAKCFTEYQAMQARVSMELIGPTHTKSFETVYNAKLEKLRKLTGNLHEIEEDGVNVSRSIGLPKMSSSFLESCFLKCFQSVWLLHKLAFSFEPPPRIFRVGHGADFENSCMKDVVGDDAALPSSKRTNLEKVGFMVTPGFRVGKSKLFKSRVYLQEVQPTGRL